MVQVEVPVDRVVEKVVEVEKIIKVGATLNPLNLCLSVSLSLSLCVSLCLSVCQGGRDSPS